jgi:fucose permease
MVALGAVGLFDGGLGVAWPSMRETFDQPLAALGVVLVAYTSGYFVTSSIGGWILERTGTGNALLAVAAGAIAGAARFAASPAWPLVLAGAALLGGSGGAADLTLNHEFAQHHGVRALGFLHAAWGLGSAAAPLIVTGFVTTGNTWRLAFVPIVVVQAALLVSYVLMRRTWAPVPSRHDEHDDVEPLDRVALAIAIGLFLVYVGVESGIGAWGFTLLTDDRGLSDAAAGAWMAAFWLSLTAGRLVLGLAGNTSTPDAILTGSVLLTIGGCAVLWLDPGGVGHLALVPLGLALASIFPVLVAVTPDRLGVHRAARAIGMQIAASAVGGAVLPSAYGLGAQMWGTDSLGPVFTATAVVLAALHGGALLRRRSTRR